jgi:hypothetical protein
MSGGILRRPWKSLDRAGQSRLSGPDQMSGNEEAKTQEHRKQQVKVNGAGFTGAYNEGGRFISNLGLEPHGR